MSMNKIMKFVFLVNFFINIQSSQFSLLDQESAIENDFVTNDAVRGILHDLREFTVTEDEIAAFLGVIQSEPVSVHFESVFSAGKMELLEKSKSKSKSKKKKRKRKIKSLSSTKKEPRRRDFDTPEKYESAWKWWREVRDNNNDSVKRSRAKKRALQLVAMTGIIASKEILKTRARSYPE